MDTLPSAAAAPVAPALGSAASAVFGTTSPFQLLSQKDVYAKHGDLLLLKAGQPISTGLLLKLKQFGVPLAECCAVLGPSGDLQPLKPDLLRETLAYANWQEEQTAAQRRTGFVSTPAASPLPKPALLPTAQEGATHHVL